jgi:hypothetical protein
VAVLMVAVLHFITDNEDPAWIVELIDAAVDPGTILVVSHVDPDGLGPFTPRRSGSISRLNASGHASSHEEPAQKQA